MTSTFDLCDRVWLLHSSKIRHGVVTAISMSQRASDFSFVEVYNICLDDSPLGRAEDVERNVRSLARSRDELILKMESPA